MLLREFWGKQVISSSDSAHVLQRKVIFVAILLGRSVFCLNFWNTKWMVTTIGVFQNIVESRAQWCFHIMFCSDLCPELPILIMFREMIICLYPIRYWLSSEWVKSYQFTTLSSPLPQPHCSIPWLSHPTHPPK